MKPFLRQVLNTRCPRCGRSDGHWCRDERGQCLTLPHAERRRATLDIVMAPLAMAAKAGAR